MSEKVYCNNCNWLNHIISNYDICQWKDLYECHHPKYKKIVKHKDGAIKKGKVEIYYDWNCKCKIINKNNDCKYYKRKWWKFWIRSNK